jgi:hypothetical protein
MRREEAEAERKRLQRDDHEHTYVVREQSVGEWDVVRMNLPHRTSDVVVNGGSQRMCRKTHAHRSSARFRPTGPASAKPRCRATGEPTSSRVLVTSPLIQKRS